MRHLAQRNPAVFRFGGHCVFHTTCPHFWADGPIRHNWAARNFFSLDGRLGKRRVHMLPDKVWLEQRPAPLPRLRVTRVSKLFQRTRMPCKIGARPTHFRFRAMGQSTERHEFYRVEKGGAH